MCDPYWHTTDGCCEKCGKPTAWKELKQNHEDLGDSICDRCAVSQTTLDNMEVER